jgi:hypothetical protein
MERAPRHSAPLLTPGQIETALTPGPMETALRHGAPLLTPLEEIDPGAWSAYVAAGNALFQHGQRQASDAQTRSECDRLRSAAKASDECAVASCVALAAREQEIRRLNLALAEARVSPAETQASSDLRERNAELAGRNKSMELELVAVRRSLETAQAEGSAARSGEVASRAELQGALASARREGEDAERSKFTRDMIGLVADATNAKNLVRTQAVVLEKCQEELAALRAQTPRRAPAVLGKEGEDEVESYLRLALGKFAEIENTSKIPHQLDLKVTTLTTPPVTIRIDSKNYCADGRLKSTEFKTFLGNVDRLDPPADAAVLFTTTAVCPKIFPTYQRRASTDIFHVGAWQLDQLIAVIHDTVVRVMHEQDLEKKPVQNSAEVSEFISELLCLLALYGDRCDAILDAAKRNQGSGGEHWRKVHNLAQAAHQASPGIITLAHVQQLGKVPNRQPGGLYSVPKIGVMKPAKRKRSRAPSKTGGPKGKRARGPLPPAGVVPAAPNAGASGAPGSRSDDEVEPIPEDDADADADDPEEYDVGLVFDGSSIQAQLWDRSGPVAPSSAQTAYAALSRIESDAKHSAADLASERSQAARPADPAGAAPSASSSRQPLPSGRFVAPVQTDRRQTLALLTQSAGSIRPQLSLAASPPIAPTPTAAQPQNRLGAAVAPPRAGSSRLYISAAAGAP